MGTMEQQATVIATENKPPRRRPQRASEAIAESLAKGPKPPLFGGFWRMGEVAMIFGESGIGKSVLAVQLADALARGEPVASFEMPTRRHKVLYVDMCLSTSQFQRRYTAAVNGDGAPAVYKFPQRFYRGRPGYDEEICAWVREMVESFHYEVVVIDDLTSLMTTSDGTAETLQVMREMKRLSHETGVAILVLADSVPSPRYDISEHDLRRSRLLCSVADSVIGLGRDRKQVKLVHFRSQGERVRWGSTNPIGCMVRKRDDGMLDMIFDERFNPKLEPEQCQLICDIKDAYEKCDMTFLEIAKEFEISKSMAWRLYHKWTPAVAAVDAAIIEPDDEEAEAEIDGNSTSESEEDGVKTAENEPYEAVEKASRYEPEPEPETAPEPEFVPPAEISAPPPRLKYTDLETDLDRLGREIFVEMRDPASGKPVIWYRRDDDGRYRRSVLTRFGVINENICGDRVYLPELRI